MRRPAALCVSLLALGLSNACGREGPVERPPDVLLVVLDTVRADRNAAYGYARDTSPQLGLLAEAGVLFEDVTSPSSWTWPAHASLFTGLPPWEHGAHLADRGAPVLAELGGFRLQAMRGDLPTLAERFREAGYDTVSLSSNPLLSADLGLVRGFGDARVFAADLETVAAARALLAEPSDAPLFLFVNLLSAHMPWGVTAAPWSKERSGELTEEGIAEWARPYLRSPPAINLYEAPFAEPPAGVYRYLAGQLEIPPEGLALLGDLYDGHIQLADFYLKELLGAWLPGRERSVVAVTSDHGEYLGEHAMLDHGYTLYSQVTAVPLVIAAPGRLPPGRRVGTPVQLQDVYDALLELAGIAGGAELLEALRGRAAPRPIQAAVWRNDRTAAAVGGRFSQGWRLYREGPQALVFGHERDEPELYDLESDPGMLRNLAAVHPDRVAALLAAARPSFDPAEKNAGETASAATASPETLERLRALGYVEPEPR